MEPVAVLENVNTNKYTVFRQVSDINDSQNADIKEIAQNGKLQLLLNILLLCSDAAQNLYKPTAYLTDILVVNFNLKTMLS